MKNRWNSTLKREAHVDSDSDEACPAAKHARHSACEWSRQPHLARTQSESGAVVPAGTVTRPTCRCPRGTACSQDT